RYGVTIYEAVVELKGKAYEVVVAEDGTLVEKVLVIEDEEVALAACPAAVQNALREQSAGGMIGDITRTSGLGKRTYEAEVEIKGKVYLVEVSETGLMSAKWLEAAEEGGRRTSSSEPGRPQATASAHEGMGTPRRRVRPRPQRIVRAVLSSRMACWTCPRARACPKVFVPWLL